MDYPGRIVTIIGIAGSLLALASVFMVWVEYYTWADLVRGSLTGWDALTDSRWADLEDAVTEKDYHTLPGWLIGLSGVSAAMFIVGHIVKRKGAKIASYVIPMLFGIALVVGIYKLLEQMGTHYYVLHVDPGIGVWAALAASIIVIAISVISTAHAAIAINGREDVQDRNGKKWCPRRDSNPGQKIRNLTGYPSYPTRA